MADALVFANDTVDVRWQGGVIHLTKGHAWDPADPLVKQYPSFFTEDRNFVHRTKTEDVAPEVPLSAQAVDQVVEQATKAPGEKRVTKAPANRAAKRAPRGKKG